MRHETRYCLLAVELSPSVVMSDEIAPGLMLATRTTTTRPIWLLKLLAKARAYSRSAQIVSHVGLISGENERTSEIPVA